MANPESSFNVAYHLEGQAIAVMQAQKSGDLLVYSEIYSGRSITSELGHRWILVGRSKLFESDCNMDFFWELDGREDEVRYTKITGAKARPDVFDGRDERPVAALIAESKIMYLSPGFDLEAWLSSRHPDSNLKNQQ